jgi:hypothetical protein
LARKVQREIRDHKEIKDLVVKLVILETKDHKETEVLRVI